MLLVSVGWVMLSSAAATEIFWRCATRRKYSSCRRSMMRIAITPAVSYPAATSPTTRTRTRTELPGK